MAADKQNKVLSSPYVWTFTTYFAEGFPYTVIRTLSSLFLRDLNVRLESVGLTSLFGLPWILKFLWGPQVDRFSTKRTWMLACQFLFQGEGDYEGTLRVCAYAGACLALAWIPVLGVFAYLYGFYLIFLGTEKSHKLDTTKAAIATLIAVLVTAAILFFVLGEERIRRPLF